MPNKRIRYLANVILISCTALFMLLIIVKGQRLALTQTEALVHQQEVGQSFTDILLYKVETVSRHAQTFNTLLSKTTVSILGLSDFNLRLGNIIFALVFFWNAAWLSKNLRTVWSQVCAFIIISAQVYFFDFFTLNSGHGVALALLMASLHNFYLYIQVDNGNHTYRTLIFGALAVYAHTSFVYYFMGLLLVLPLLALADGETRGQAWWKLSRAIFVVGALSALVLFIPLKSMWLNAPLDNGVFWTTTVQSGLGEMFYGNFEHWLAPLTTGIAAVLIGASTLLVFDVLVLKKTRRFFYEPLLVLLFIMVALQWLIGSYKGLAYFTSADALSYMLIFLTLIVFILERMQEPKIKAWLRNLIFSAVALLMLINFVSNFNLKYTLNGKPDAGNKKMLRDLEKSLPSGESLMTLGASPEIQLSLNFYQQDKYSKWLAPIKATEPDDALNYFVVYPKTDSTNFKALEEAQWPLVKEYFNGLKLYKKP